MKVILLALAGSVALPAQTPPLQAPALTVFSDRVANQSPGGTFAMPVSALRFEPRVDVQGRNLVEGQADVTIRGGIFENTGFQVGAVTLIDAQTGHYLAEIPIAPAMLGSADVITGDDLVLGAANTTVGAIVSQWRRLRHGGAVSVGVGDFHLRRGELYQSVVLKPARSGYHFGADFAVAHSQSQGSVPFGEHEFNRIGGRFQLASESAQTDLYAGYQAKTFGWPNLYTPFNSNETENLQTVLFSLNQRVNFGQGDFVEAGAYHRRNKDDYAFNRFAPLTNPHPFQHTTWVNGVAAGGRRHIGDLAWNVRAELLEDNITSTSLTAGRYRSRRLTKLALVPEKAWVLAEGGRWVAKAGASYDDSNRDDGSFSPTVSLAREFAGEKIRRVYLSFARTTQLPSYTALNSSATSGLFRGNSSLGRESSRNFELGVSGQWVGWSAQAAVFVREDDALVDWTFARGVTARRANAVDIRTSGFEGVVRRSWRALDLVLGYSLLTKDSDYRGASVDASFYALNYARQRFTAAATLRLGRGFEVRIDNVARIQADNMLRTAGGDETLLTTMSLVYRPPVWRGVEISVQADNLWNSRFQDIPAVPAAPRQVTGGVAYAW